MKFRILVALTTMVSGAALLGGAGGCIGKAYADTDASYTGTSILLWRHQRLVKSLEDGELSSVMPFLPGSDRGTLPIGLVSADLLHASDWINLQVHSGDSLSSLFHRAGLDATQWMTVLKLGGQVDALRHLRVGDTLKIRKTQSGKLVALEFPLTSLKRLQVIRFGHNLEASVETTPARIREVRIAGQVRHTLIGALRNAGISYRLAVKFADIFHGRTDLSRNLRSGSRFVLILRRYYADGHLIKAGPITAAKLTLQGHTIDAFRYTNSHGNAAYYDQHGRSLKPSIIRTPLNYRYVSSPFSLHRLNPVTHVWEPHYGVDLAARTGTPIKAAASGTVKFIGRDGGYGNLVELRNFGPYTTRYAHMSRFAKGLHRGSYVHQGEVIGYVGATGETTGPHLHFEIRVNGVPHNPLKMHLPNGAPIPKSRKPAFMNTIQPLVADLNSTRATGQTVLAERTTPEVGGIQCLPASWFHPRITFVSRSSDSCGGYTVAEK